MSYLHRTLRLTSRPVGFANAENFQLSEAPISPLQPQQVLIRTTHISLDPAMRGWMREGKSYISAVPLGDVMRAYGTGVVLESKDDKWKPGDQVVGMLGVQSHAILQGKHLQPIDTQIAPAERWLGGLGMTGLTAYFGLLDIGRPKAGETLLVSAAAGAVGSVVGQLGKIHGCRVIGIAGGSDKCRFVIDKLGYDACIDYKSGNLYQQLKDACPAGIDIYFDNVGGDLLDHVLRRMNRFGRIPVCGMISQYNNTDLPKGPRQLIKLVTQRLTLQGFIVFDHRDSYSHALKELSSWYQQGKLLFYEDVRVGDIACFPEMLQLLYSGQKLGKLVLQLV